MINPEKGKRLGTVYISNYLSGKRLVELTAHLAIVPISIEKYDHNWEIIGTSEFFDPLDDMETVPTYDISPSWLDGKVASLKLTRHKYEN